MTNFAYLRVSKDTQDVANQKHGVLAYAKSRSLEPLELVEDTASGKVNWQKRGIGELLEKAVKGDVVLVAEVSRMARSTLQVLEIMQEAAEKGVAVHVVKNNLVLDESMMAKITVVVLGLAAEIEREFISERTKEGLARRKAEGKTLGRPKGAKSKKLKLDGRKKEIEGWQEKGLNKTAIAKLCGVSRTTLDGWLRLNG